MKTTFIALRLFIVLTLITGIAYPLLVTSVAQAFWPFQAGGSLVKKGTEIEGSLLIAQKFEKDIYFHPRPSAVDYNAQASSGSNKGPTNADLKKTFEDGEAAGLPPDMIFASGSGLDPHISPELALTQVDRVATARHMGGTQKNELVQLVENSIEDRDLGFLGQPRVNVLSLNLELDRRFH